MKLKEPQKEPGDMDAPTAKAALAPQRKPKYSKL